MKYNIDEQYNAVVISFKKKLIGGPESERLSEDIHRLLEKEKKNLVADLSDVAFVNSTGIGILIRAFTTVKNAGGELKLAGMSEKINGLLSITKLNSVFDIHASVDEAVKSF